MGKKLSLKVKGLSPREIEELEKLSEKDEELEPEAESFELPSGTKVYRIGGPLPKDAY